MSKEPNAPHPRVVIRRATLTDVEAMHALMSHDWPGNIRELENAVEHAFVLCPGGQIEPAHLPESVTGSATQGARLPANATLKEFEAHLIRAAIERAGGSRQKAAEALGIHKSTLFRKLKALGISVPKKGKSSEKGE